MAATLRQRLAMANGHNARWCKQALEELKEMESVIRKCHQAALPHPYDEGSVDPEWLSQCILEYTTPLLKRLAPPRSNG